MTIKKIKALLRYPFRYVSYHFRYPALPTTPGLYTDQDGYVWLRTSDGHWYDHTGATKPTRYNWWLRRIRLTLKEEANVRYI